VPHIRGGSRGAHIVRVNVEIPKKLSNKQKELLQEFAKEHGKSFWHR
jgi:molecular chaperone DnaJ